MVITRENNYFRVTHKGAGYAIREDDTSWETLVKAAEFLSSETRETISPDQIREAMHGAKA